MPKLDQTAEIRLARSKFAAMAGAYSLGVFNDNFFKQAVSLLAMTAGLQHLQGWVAALFSLPFIIFAAPAGWLADRFAKRHVVLASKGLEIGAMLLAAVGICTASWPLIMVMVFTMAFQSTVFSPALNGSIPELYPAWYVLKANSIVKMCTTTGVLLGIIAAGVALDAGGEGAAWSGGRLAVAAVVVGVAVTGFLISLLVPYRSPADPTVRFPWAGPVQTIRTLWRLRCDSLLCVVVWADAAVWFLAVLQSLLINRIGKEQFGLSNSATSRLLVAELGGVAVGGLLCGWLAGGGRWFRVLAPAAAVLGAAMACMAAAPLLAGGAALWAAGLLLAVAGVAGGLLLVPLESFIQARPAAREKGAVIAAANCAAFTAMMAAGLLDAALSTSGLRPTTAFALQSVGAGALAAWLLIALPRRRAEAELR